MKKINVHTLIKIGYELQEMFPAMEFKFVISLIDELDYEWYTEEEVLNLIYEYLQNTYQIFVNMPKMLRYYYLLQIQLGYHILRNNYGVIQ